MKSTAKFVIDTTANTVTSEATSSLASIRKKGSITVQQAQGGNQSGGTAFRIDMAVPEPSSAALLGVSLVGLVLWQRAARPRSRPKAGRSGRRHRE